MFDAAKQEFQSSLQKDLNGIFRFNNLVSVKYTHSNLILYEG